ncbi:MAG TPA: hypothetical protein VFU69_02025 [Ktedonobacterales bacterium]|nr:hypothetical protein [Ktedonobacterales bacterium]
MEQEYPPSRDSESPEAPRAAYQGRRGNPDIDPLLAQELEELASPSSGWSGRLAWVFGLLGFLLAVAAWMAMGLALLTPLTANQTLLTAVLLGPVVGAVVSLLGIACALLATRRARAVGSGVTAPITLVWVSTAILIGGLVFGGLVSYPRAQLGSFGQAIQAHCARFAQSLESSYGNPPDISKIEQDPLGLVATLQRDQAALGDDQAALNALVAPDPAYQPLLNDCRSLAAKDMQVTKTLLSELVALPPDLPAATKTITQYQSDTTRLLTEIQQLGAQLKQQVFAPFQPG